MKNYQCKKCGVVVQSKNSPPMSGCPEGSHSWSNLSDVGDKKYQCKKCGTLVKAKMQPSTSACPKGSHSWSKL